ncbi:M1 family aminopeptidase [Parvularcula maris]|uniref:M1 family aminopeptidase n=1 Tax=Parvularcula maris TaxID=2965077 RepID=UPI002114B526|nr:M1 family aminopeptidase [Parvularcula maris]
MASNVQASADDIAAVDLLESDVALVIDPGSAGVRGQQSLTFDKLGAGRRVTFETEKLTVLQASLDGKAVRLVEDGSRSLTLRLPEAEAGGRHVLKLSYEFEAKGRGFVRQDELLASSYFACDWMVCNQEDFSDRFHLTLSLDLPKGMRSIGPGGIASRQDREGRTRTTWASGEAFPAYVYGFAVGRLERLTLETPCETELVVFAPPGASDLEKMFEPSCNMLRFFEEKAGAAYPAASYAQVYLPGSRAAQEAASHSLIGGVFLDPILEQPQEDWVIAHELAHQWWGNRVTAQDLSHFWLNEGIVTFLVAAWKEQRWGHEAYDKEIVLAEARWRRRIETSGDVGLAHDGSYASLGDRRSIQYYKGAVFLDRLRDAVGEEAFWQGLAQFTAGHIGRSVGSQNFQSAMQDQTDEPMDTLFDEWVWGR